MSTDSDERCGRFARGVAAAFVFGLALRLVVALAFPRFSSGDEFWYRGMARGILEGLPVWSVSSDHMRGPGTPLYVALLWKLAGSESLVVVRVANAVLLALTPILAAAIARRLAPRRPVVELVATWLVALNPIELRFVQVVMSEALAVPLALGFTLSLLRLGDSVTLRRVGLAGLLGALLIHVRVDAAALVVAVCLVGAAAAWLLGPDRRKAPAGWLASGALAIALCLPWSWFASARLGRPIFVAHMDQLTSDSMAHRRGWMRWLATTYRPRDEWLRLWWWGYHSSEVTPQWLHDDLFDTPKERADVESWLREGQSIGRMNPDTEAKFQALGDARAAADPFRFWIGHPLRRTGNVWFSPTDDDFAAHMAPVRRSIPSQILAWGLGIWRVLCGLGFLAAIVAFFRIRAATLIPATMVLLRTAQMGWGPQIAWGLCMFEIRYLAPVQPIALVLLAAAIPSRSARK